MTMEDRAKKSARRPYHHGDLRNVIVQAAVEVIEEIGYRELSLRELARRAGVSHAAPAHHFIDRSGLLTAVAAEGYRRLATVLDRAHEQGSVLEVGVAYVEFAVANPRLFDLMFSPDAYRRDDDEVVDATDRASVLLRGPVIEIVGGASAADGDRVLMAWSVVHGFAQLWISGNLDAEREGEEVASVARRVLAQLSPGLGAPPDEARSGR